MKYIEFDKKWWQGRNDGEEDAHLRWHQVISGFGTEVIPETNAVFLGYSTDTGVTKNKGRKGAAAGPEALRMAMSNFPALNNVTICDAGNILPEGNVEKEQENFAEKINAIVSSGAISIGLGGGHDIAFAHYSGIKSHLRHQKPGLKLGVINFDAHYDIRDRDNGAHSGNSFSLMAEQENREKNAFHHLSIGIQKSGNTAYTFKKAEDLGIQTILAEDFTSENFGHCMNRVTQFIEETDIVYFTICMDSFSAAFAPGVSAVAFNGIIPDSNFIKLLRTIAKSEKLISFDIAELNPTFDIDQRTAKLAASFIYEVLSAYKPIQVQ